MKTRVYLELSIIELTKLVMLLFWDDYVKPKYYKKQNCFIWIVRVSLYTEKHMIAVKTMQKMLKQCLAIKIMN